MALTGSLSGKAYDYYNHELTPVSVRIDWSATQDTTQNRSYITAALYVKSTGVYSITNISINTTIMGSVTTAARTVAANDTWVQFGVCSWTQNHNQDGTGGFYLSGSFVRTTPTTVEYRINSGGVATTYFALNTIPRASALGAISAFDIEETFYLPVTKYSASFYDVLRISLGGVLIKTVENYTSNSPITLTDGELMAAYRMMGAAAQASYSFGLTTYSNSGKTTTIGASSGAATGRMAGTARVKAGGQWRRGRVFINVAQTFKPALIYYKGASGWRRGR